MIEQEGPLRATQDYLGAGVMLWHLESTDKIAHTPPTWKQLHDLLETGCEDVVSDTMYLLFSVQRVQIYVYRIDAVVKNEHPDSS